MNDTLRATAAVNGGIFTRRQALDCGYSDVDLRAAVRAMVIVRLRHGAYCPREVYDASDETARHLLLARAVVARQHGRVALTGVSAAALHGLTLHGQNLQTVHVVRLDSGSSRHAVRAKHHVVTPDIEADLETKDGLLVVNPARAVWELATCSTLESGVCTADSAFRLYPGLREPLERIAPTFDRRPGSRCARMVIQLADGRAASAGESLSRVLFFRHGLPMPDLQVEIRDGEGRLLATCDFGWPEYRHVGEFDGKIKYGRLLRPGESPGDAVFREKRREDQVRGEAYGMTRWTWVDLAPRPGLALVYRLQADLGRSRALYASTRAG